MGFCISSCELRSLPHRAGLLCSLWALMPSAASPGFRNFMETQAKPYTPRTPRGHRHCAPEAVTSCVKLGQQAGKQALGLQ